MTAVPAPETGTLDVTVAPPATAHAAHAVPDLAELATVARGLETAPAAAAIEWAWDRFGPDVVLAASFQDCVLIDLAMQVAPEIEVVFLDTQYHFAETLWYVEQVRERYGLNLNVVSPGVDPDNLWVHDPDSCCAARKVEPLRRALEGKAAWLSGLRRSETPQRGERADRVVRHRSRHREGQPDRAVDRLRRRALHEGARAPGAPAARPRVPVDRLLALHPAGFRRRRPAGGPVGGQRQARVRPALLSPALRPFAGSVDPWSAAGPPGTIPASARSPLRHPWSRSLGTGIPGAALRAARRLRHPWSRSLGTGIPGAALRAARRLRLATSPAMPVHEVAQRGFDTQAETYERARPSYPPAALDWLAGQLGITPGRTVVDLAAGTGKLTRLLAPYGARLLAVEPVEGMRNVLRASLPRVPVVAATAESLPFASATIGAVTVAQAFHWFDAGAAIPELHRVLAPGGRLGLVWNARDRSVGWVDRIWSVLDRVEKRAPWREHESWSESALPLDGWFGALHPATFHHVQELSPEGVVERFRSVSHVAVLPPDEQERVFGRDPRDPRVRSRHGGPSGVGHPVPRRRVLLRAARVTNASMRTSAAVALGRAAGRLSRLTGRGEGATISGRVINALAPDALVELARDQDVALVSATNGKTTTTRLLAASLEAAGRTLVTNSTGANLTSGIVPTLASAREPGVAVLEVDERVLPRVVDRLRARLLVLGNLSRDQLDRYGEVHAVGDSWRRVAESNPSIEVVANASDPHVVWAASPATTTWVALGPGWRNDAATCPSCGALLRFDAVRFECPDCGFAQPDTPNRIDGDTLVLAGERLPLRLALPGRWNVANAALAVTAAVTHFGVAPEIALDAVSHVTTIAGRYMDLPLGDGRTARVILAKNPAGWSEVLRFLADRAGSAVIAVNAHIADGKDPSWLWDVPYELLQGRNAAASGERHLDVAVRLRYAEVDHFVEPDPLAAARAPSQATTCTSSPRTRCSRRCTGGSTKARRDDRTRESAVRVGLVYPELLGTYGDRGNAVVLTQRCRWRGIPAELVEVTAGTPVPRLARRLSLRRRRGRSSDHGRGRDAANPEPRSSAGGRAAPSCSRSVPGSSSWATGTTRATGRRSRGSGSSTR